MKPVEDLDAPPPPPNWRVSVAAPRPLHTGSGARASPGAPTCIDSPAHSPTTSLYRVLIAMTTALLLAMVLGAQGIVHAGTGMPDGPQRDITLDVGRTAFQVSRATHLDWPWRRFQAALGRPAQPDIPPLLASRPNIAEVEPPVRYPVRDVARVARSRPAVRGTLQRAPARSPTLQPAGRFRRSSAPGADQRRAITARSPLRMLVTGDSLTEYLGPRLVSLATAAGPVRGFVDTHYGTGLTRPDFVDWSLVAQQQMRADNPDVTVVFLGGNDFQNMTLPNGRFFQAITPAWTDEYARRAAMCMRVWSRGGRRVYWLSLPPARDRAWSRANAQINLALRRAAASVPGARFLDVLGPITDHGRYADFVPVHGQPTLVREPDGIHLTMSGSAIVAGEVLAVLRRDWHLARKS